MVNPFITTLFCIILNHFQSHQADLFGPWGVCVCTPCTHLVYVPAMSPYLPLCATCKPVLWFSCAINSLLQLAQSIPVSEINFWGPWADRSCLWEVAEGRHAQLMSTCRNCWCLSRTRWCRNRSTRILSGNRIQHFCFLGVSILQFSLEAFFLQL